jgi:tetratricopeptide (TPR) repeat protein
MAKPWVLVLAGLLVILDPLATAALASEAEQDPALPLAAKAGQALKEARFPEALEAARAALDLSPNLLPALAVRAQAAQALGEFEDSLAAWKAASQQIPRLGLEAAVVAAQLGRLEEVAALLSRDALLTPAEARFLFEVYLEHGEQERAKALAQSRGWVSEFGNHCAMTPSDERPRELLALLAVVFHPQTADCGLPVAQDFTNGGRTRLPRFLLHELIRHHRDARIRSEAFAFLLQRLPAHDVVLVAESLNIMGYRLERRHRRPDLAIPVYERAMRADPQFSWPASNLVGIYFERKQYDRALEWARRAVAVNPNHQRAQRNLGLAAFWNGRSEEALGAMRRAGELNPNDPEVHSLLGRMLVDLKRPQEAIPALTRAVELAPQNEKDRQLLAQLGQPLAPSARGEPAPDPVAMVEEVLSLSGGNSAFDSLAKLVRGILEEGAQAEQMGDVGLVRRILDQEISVGKLRVQVAAYLLAHFDGERFRRYIEHERVPLARRMDDLVAANQGIEAETIAQWGAASEQSAEGRERLAFAQRISVVCQIPEMLLDIARAVNQSVARAVNEILPPEKRISTEQVDRGVGQLAPPLRQFVPKSVAYSYRSASVDELARYLQHLETEIIGWHINLHREASVRAAAALADRAVRRIIEARLRVPHA